MNAARTLPERPCVSEQIKRALKELFALSGCSAAPDQLCAIAEKHAIPTWQLEGHYIDAVAKLENE